MMKSESRKRYATSARVMDRYDRHRTTLNRWLKDETLGFSKPTRRRGRLYWKEDELDAWDRAAAGGDFAADVAAVREKLGKRKCAGWASAAPRSRDERRSRLHRVGAARRHGAAPGHDPGDPDRVSSSGWITAR